MPSAVNNVDNVNNDNMGLFYITVFYFRWKPKRVWTGSLKLKPIHFK